MVSDNKKAKADPAPKSEAAAKDKSTAGEAVSKTKGGEAAAAAAPSNYSRGEGQKPVTTAYKENWNAIYAKKNAKKNAKKKKR
jgi:hypothetical protein